MESPNIKKEGYQSIGALTEKEASEQSLLLWETVSRNSSKFTTNKFGTRGKINKEFVIRAFTGGITGQQSNAFTVQLNKILKEYMKNKSVLNPGNVRVVVELVSNTDVSNRKWLPSQLIDFLLESDLHFILTHIHQGLTSKNIGWIIPSLLKHLNRLKYHPGFPTGNQLMCPVFTQDKIRYIRFLNDFCIPTFEIRITTPGFKHSAQETFQLKEWCLANDTDNCGWVVKAPFTTNCHYVKFCHALDDVLDIINSSSEDPDVGFCQIPYLMIQPCLYNRKEYKVVCLNEDPIYVASIGSNNLKCRDGINKAFSSKGNKDLFEFSKSVLQEFKRQCPYAITSGLFRVDIFQMRSGKYVVNELESMEACYYGGGDKESHVRSFIDSYWDKTIRHLMNNTLTMFSTNVFNHQHNENFGGCNEAIVAINCHVENDLPETNI